MQATLSGTNLWTNLTRRSWLFVLAAVAMLLTPALIAQNVTATIAGTVTDPKGAVVQGASVTIINDATHSSRPEETNKNGEFSAPGLIPDSYTVKVVAQGFAPKEITGLDLHAGDQVRLPAFVLAVGSATDTVTVTSVAGQILTTDNGQRAATLTYSDIQDMALESRDTTELLKVLPGVVNMGYNAVNQTTGSSAIGNGMGVNGAPNQGGATLTMNGANILDPGADFSSLATINPEMTQEVQVQTSNFGADQAAGPVVINSTSKSGGEHFHGEAYFDVRNNVLNANNWSNNHRNISQGPASYYYPGGSVSGPVPFFKKKLFFFGALEYLYQNPGNSNSINVQLPSPEMMNGDFSDDNADNLLLCPYGFYDQQGGQGQQAPNWCQNIANDGVNPYFTVLPDGTFPITVNGTVATKPANDPLSALQGQGYGGTLVGTGWLNPNMQDFAKLWPSWSSPYILKNPQAIAANGGNNYQQPVLSTDNGWIANGRLDYNWNSTNQSYISYQQGYDSTLSAGQGCNFYGGCFGNAIQFPGGGIYSKTYSKVLNGHWVHIFSPTLTNEFIASWVWGNIPKVPNNPSADFRSVTGFSAPSYWGNPIRYMPNLPLQFGNYDWLTFLPNDYWEPNNYYIVEKQTPTFSDNLTKVWGKHTVKMGAMTSNTDNFQGNQTSVLEGNLGIGGNPSSTKNYFATVGQSPQTGNYTGNVGSYNPLVNMLTGTLNNYTESNYSPLTDLAFQEVALYADDSIKATRKLSLEVGARFEHLGYWYDRGGIGLPVFYANRVLPDFYSGKTEPGYYWHSIDSSLPLSGRPNRLGFLSPRVGLTYDVFGNGKTTVHGGWGAYRFTEQSNDPLGANALATSQNIQTFNAGNALPNNSVFLLSQIGQLNSVAPNCQIECASNGGAGFDPNDYEMPLTYDYNFTIDQRIPWNMLVDIGYVGSHSEHMGPGAINGTVFGGGGGFFDMNKTPLGAYGHLDANGNWIANPDPITGVGACNPEQLNAPCSPNNTSQDYHPYGRVKNLSTPTNPNGFIYGNNNALALNNVNYSNYNALQVSLVKRSGPVTLNINWTWSKTLGTVGGFDSFHLASNNTYTSEERPFIFNSEYIYREPNFYHGDRILAGAINGWTISGISLWQSGGNSLGGINIRYDPATIPQGPNPYNLSASNDGISGKTIYGTDANMAFGRPQLTCNPHSNLAHYQVYKACFTAAPFGSPGGMGLPYVAGAPFMENDLALYKTFTIHEQNKVQFRLSAFDWLNRSPPTFGGTDQTTEYYYYNWQTHAITPNTSNTGSNSGPGGGPTNPVSPYGVMHFKSGGGTNNARTLELDLKYTF